jgi:hypothetical protein
MGRRKAQRFKLVTAKIRPTVRLTLTLQENLCRHRHTYLTNKRPEWAKTSRRPWDLSGGRQALVDEVTDSSLGKKAVPGSYCAEGNAARIFEALL